MSLTAGMRLGHYEIGEAIGAGGMGEVFRATDTKLGRAVALKVLPADMARDPERCARFQREARAVAALNHPNIVTIHSVEEAGGIHFLTMELVEGRSLADLIPERGFPIDRILSTATVLADALAAAHEKGIVHRDLKPANIMVTTEGRLKVLDFGLAKDMRAADIAGPTAVTGAGLTEVGVVMGTPAYMSPEQVAGRPVDHRTDIFSLGIILYQMVCGRRPFEGATSIEVASSILRDTPRPLQEARGEAPADLSRLIRRCLEKDPQRRVQTARDVCNELLEVVPSATITTPGTRTTADQGFWIAVLPFKYRGSNADLEALADGLSEGIVTGLSRFSYLRVIARTSTSRYANTTEDVRTIGNEIGARYVMEGSIRQAGSQLRVGVQLVDTTTGAHLWAETYSRSFQPDAIFDLQDDLVPGVVSTLADFSGVLPRSMSEVLRDRKPQELTPYEAVLRAAGFYDRITPEEHVEIRACLEHAVEQAPDHADAWAFLSRCYQDEYRLGCNPRPDPLGRALAAARRAVELAPANHIAYDALAAVMFFRRDHPAFRRAAERAIALNPMDSSTVAYMGTLIAYSGDWDRGCALVERSRLLNPNHAGWYWLPPFYNAYRMQDYASALDAAVKVNMPGYIRAQTALVMVYGQLGEREAASTAMSVLVTLKPDIDIAARGEFEKWFHSQPELVEHFLEGLRKAGLDVPAL